MARIKNDTGQDQHDLPIVGGSNGTYLIAGRDDPSADLENLMHAGQQSMNRFDDALATAMGVPNKRSVPMGPVFSPFAFAIDMRREYVTQFWRFWNAAVIWTLTLGTKSAIPPVRGDKRFKDRAWQETP